MKKTKPLILFPKWEKLRKQYHNLKESEKSINLIHFNNENIKKCNDGILLKELLLNKDYLDSNLEVNDYLAIDCEMVACGIINSLARVTIVNYKGEVIIDEFIKQDEPVTDYRTWVSGINESILLNKGKCFKKVKNEVENIIKDKILIGHNILMDLKCLKLKHPINLIRDTAKYPPLLNCNHNKSSSLRELIFNFFRLNIQDGEHCSLIDARATMALYRYFRINWEKNNLFYIFK